MRMSKENGIVLIQVLKARRGGEVKQGGEVLRV
jgi:hypothetical protein